MKTKMVAQIRGLRLVADAVRCRLVGCFVSLIRFRSELVRHVETLCEKGGHGTLTIRNVVTNHEFAVLFHVIDRVQLEKSQ